MPDLNTSIKGYLAELAEWWATPRYRAAIEHLKEVKPFCERCGRPTTTALHETADYKKGYDHYCRVVEDLSVAAGCQRCNKEERRNRHPCPACVEEYKKDPQWWIRYIGFDEDVCLFHRKGGQKVIQEAVAKKAARTATGRFPCRHRRMAQGCRNKKHMGACDKTAQNCRTCEHFGRRKP